MNQIDAKHMTKEIKIYGLKRTGTNYIKALIEKNFDATIDDNKGGWKHGPYIKNELQYKETDVIVMIKDPVAWLDSLRRYLKSQWSPDFFMKHYIWEYNTMYMHWINIKLDSHKLIVIKYENLAYNTEDTLHMIAERLDLRQTLLPLNIIPGVIKSGGQITDIKFNKDYYINKQYIQHYSPHTIELIYKMLNPELKHRFGYALSK